MTLKQHTIIKFSTIIFIFLFIIIFYVENTAQISTTNISQIDTTYLNKIVKIEGKIIKQKKINETIFLEIKDNTSTIPAIIFKTNFKINQSNQYLFEGKIVLYQKRPEIIIEKIMLKK